MRRFLLMLTLVAVVGAATPISAAQRSGTQTVMVPATALPQTGGVNAGFTLKAGLPITLTASGQSLYCGGGCPADPNGQPLNQLVSTAPVPTAPIGTLLAKIGDGAWVAVGSGPVTLTGSGTLFLAYNDTYGGDNSGTYTVTLTFACQPGNGFGDQNHYHCGPPGQD